MQGEKDPLAKTINFERGLCTKTLECRRVDHNVGSKANLRFEMTYEEKTQIRKLKPQTDPSIVDCGCR